MPRRILSRAAARVALAALVLLAAQPLMAQATRMGLISDGQLERFGLSNAWSAALPASGQGVIDMVLEGDALFAITDRGVVHAIGAGSGQALWTTKVGQIGSRSMGVAASDRYVAAVVGPWLYLLDRSTGTLVWEQALGSAPTAGPAVGAVEVFVPVGQGVMEAYPVERQRLVDTEARRFSGPGVVSAKPHATAGGVAWGTLGGTISVRTYDAAVLQFDFQTGREVAAPVHHAGSMVLGASLNGSVFALDDKRGTLMWRFPTAAPVRHQPVGVGDAVYVIPERGGLYKLALASGALEWQAAGPMYFLSASPTQVVAADEIGRLMVLDAASGHVQGTLRTEGMFDQFVINDQDAKVYVGNRLGLLQAIEPIAAAPTEEAPAEGDMPPAANPFDTPATDQPQQPQQNPFE